VITVNGELVITNFRRDFTTAKNKNGKAYPKKNTKIPKFYLHNFAERESWCSNNVREVPGSNPGPLIIYPEVFPDIPPSPQENSGKNIDHLATASFQIPSLAVSKNHSTI
jgi:hypothetical protein